ANSAQRLAAFRTQAEELRHRMAATPLAEATAVYIEALRHDPDDAQLHENYAEFLEETGDLGRAAVERQTVCGLIPHYYFAYFSLGRVLKEQGKLAEAQDALGKSIELNPRQAELHRELGVVLARRGRWKEAWSELELARTLGLPDPQLCLFSAEVLWKLDRRADAFTKLREALDMDPNYWEAHYRLGEDLAIEGRVAEAAAEFQQVVSLPPNYTRAHSNLAVALLNMNRPDEAAREFEETLRLDPHDRQALDFLGKYSGRRAKP
ncbi:MAG: tetratricopeptide repeat protein, partial [Limisphaerales bacterium]